MRTPFSVRLALMEGRSGIRRVGWFLAAVALGVGSLVALYSFQRDAEASVRREARVLLGGDLRLQGSSPFDERAVEVLDSLAAQGAIVARGTSLASVVSVPGADRARLLQVNAVDEYFPAAGEVEEEPEGVWACLPGGSGVVADPQVLQQLGVSLGDSLRVGTLELVVTGSATGLPVDFGIEWVAGPPLYISLDNLSETGLTEFGSLAQYRAWVGLPDAEEARQVRDRYREEFQRFGISIETAQDEAEGFASGFENLSRFLGLVGLLALLLGGIGVGSAVNVYLRERLPSMAILRCIGARRGTLLRAYLLQAVALGALGAGVGVLLGLCIQFSLPILLRDVLPFELSPTWHPEAVVAGWLLGAWVAVLFSLFPLLRVHGVSPLGALRAEVEDSSSPTSPQGVALAMVVLASLFGLCTFQLGDAGQALVVTLATAGALGLLSLVAMALGRGARALLPPSAPFPVRQGIAGLFRPGNQTIAVVTALGVGAFLMSTLLVVESGLRSELSLEFGPDQPTLLLFDIQRDQAEGVRGLLRGEGMDDGLVPIVPARLEAVDGVSVEEILSRGVRRRRWMYNRLYRNTYSAEQSPDERMTVGRWWDDPLEDPPVVRNAVASGAARVSLEVDLAEGLGVEIGDRIVWNVQGVPVTSVISSLREVEWSSVHPNFFAVFEPGSLDEAPATFVALSSSEDVAARQRIQGALLEDYPNVSFLDISLVQETLERLTRQIGRAFRALAGFILGGGTLVLFASLLTTRFKRRRESALLKTIGASGRTIRGILFSEYAALGGIGAATGILLGGLGGHLLLDWQFELDGGVPWATLLLLWLGILVLSVLVGWSVSGPVLRASPLTTLREDGR